MRKTCKKVLSLALATTCMLGASTTVSAQTNLQAQMGNAVNAQVKQVLSEIQLGASARGSLSGLLPWYEDTGTSIPEGCVPDYSVYHILENAQVGDIIYEAKGGYGVTGHIAIVEGIFVDPATQIKYCRMIESTAPGVIRGILERECVDKWDVHLLRVKDATPEQKQAAVDFCISQLGKGYNLDLGHDTSADEKDWYCSELVWAAYYNQGIDIETKNMISEPGITPRDINASDAVVEIAFK